MLASTTNYFNLSTTPGSQANTNLWPALTVSKFGLGARYVGLASSFACGAANSGVVTYQWAPSPDGSLWLTNTANLVVVQVTANGTTAVTYGTNYDSGAWPFLSLYSVANTNATVFVTNHVLSASSKNQ